MTSTDNEVIIKVDNVSKKFCRDFKKSLWYGLKDTVSDIFNLNNNEHEYALPPLRKVEFWANQNISLEVKRGESLGLIGCNGAGKTTLLKMLNGLMKPDTGSIEMHGKIGALIALGAGFNPILTGRENIYVNGAILGLSKKNINKKVEEIIEFAEIEEAINAPVRTYSSGMQVRLGFAIAGLLIKPDILLLDEVLAVGDFKFRAKCLARINQLKQSGTSLILVSHIAQQIIQNTDKCLYLQNGRVQALGETREIYRLYENQNNESFSNEDECAFGGVVKSNGIISDISFSINTKEKKDINSVSAFEEVTFITNFKCNLDCELGVTIIIHSMDGDRIAVFNNLLDNAIVKINNQNIVSFKLWIKSLHLISGNYIINLVIQNGPEYLFRNTVIKFNINKVGQENNLYNVGLLRPIIEWM
jgi:lipopolysaccharide transport system ATP-binding protein